MPVADPSDVADLAARLEQADRPNKVRITERDACLSDDGVYRYHLTRRWAGAGGDLLWVMLNPSTADADTDDHTIGRIVTYSRDWGAASLTVVNLFAYRAAQPADLARAADPVGPLNLDHLHDALRTHDVIVTAWGDVPRPLLTRRPPFEAWAAAAGRRLWCLGTTTKGSPRHPARLPNAVTRTVYR